MIQYLFLLAITAIGFSKAEFFKTMELGDASSIAALEKKIAGSTVNDDQKAYYGAVLMKASEYQKTPGDKLKKFKEGKILLEEVIQNSPSNVEYRFLRLMIQENAPKILKYNTNIKEDAAFIKDNLSTVSKEVKTAIIHYSETSTHLNL